MKDLALNGLLAVSILILPVPTWLVAIPLLVIASSLIRRRVEARAE